MRKMLKQMLTKLKIDYLRFRKHLSSAIHAEALREAELYKPNSKTPRKN